MATAAPTQSAGERDPTFRKYDLSSAKKYLQHRGGYADKLIEVVIAQHTSSGGGLDVVLDVGCGPGNATRSLAPFFQHAVGADPGHSMIEAAKTVPSSTKLGAPITFEVSAAENLSGLDALKKLSPAGESNALETVDLITAATAAHWFDMPLFWGEAAKVLKPGGSVIIWCTGGFYCDPNTTPNPARLQEFLNKFELEVLAPYEMPGNKLMRELYVDLGMPWECLGKIEAKDGDNKRKGLKELLGQFDEKDFVRLEFNKDGELPPGESFFAGENKTDLESIRNMMDTVSPVTRWREANKEKVERGEMEDVVDFLMRNIKEIMEEVPEGIGRTWIEAGGSVVVLVVKKRK